MNRLDNNTNVQSYDFHIIDPSQKLKIFQPTLIDFEEFYKFLSPDQLKKYPILKKINKVEYELISKFIKENSHIGSYFYFRPYGGDNQKIALITIDSKELAYFILKLYKDDEKFYFSYESGDVLTIINLYKEAYLDTLEFTNPEFTENYFDFFLFCENARFKPVPIGDLLKNNQQQEIANKTSEEIQIAPSFNPNENSLFNKIIKTHPAYHDIDQETAADNLQNKPKGTFVIHKSTKKNFVGLSYVKEENHQIGYLEFLIVKDIIYYRGKPYYFLSDKELSSDIKYQENPKILKQIKDYETALRSFPFYFKRNHKDIKGILDRLENEKLITDFLVAEVNLK